MNNNQNQPVYTDLEVVDNEYRDRDYEINISIPEFSLLLQKVAISSSIAGR